jgi:hypothetical protein
VILSREADAWLREDEIPVVTFTEANGKPLRRTVGEGKSKQEEEVRGPAIALPLYQGRMIWQYDASKAIWNGPGPNDWMEQSWCKGARFVDGQHLMAAVNCMPNRRSRISFRDVQNATNQRTFIGAIIPGFPSGNKVPELSLPGSALIPILLCLNSVCVDRILRIKMGQNSVNWFYVKELPVANQASMVAENRLASQIAGLAMTSQNFAPHWLQFIDRSCAEVAWRKIWAFTTYERRRRIAVANAMAAVLYGLNKADLIHLLKDCDWESTISGNHRKSSGFDSKAFWRVGRDEPPELRETILSIVAFVECRRHSAFGTPTQQTTNQIRGQIEFLHNWIIPSFVCLSDYDLGHDDRAKEPQPVRSVLGPRYLDWQLAQTAEESWVECRLHARNLLGEAAYQQLLSGSSESPAANRSDPPAKAPAAEPAATPQNRQKRLFE